MSLRGLWRRLRSRSRTIRRSTKFGVAKIYETRWGGRPIRILSVEGTMQSATYLDAGWCDLPFPYLQLYDCLFEANPCAYNLLMLGGGGFAYPKHIIAHHPEARIDVVEIDPAVTRIAYEHFLLDRLMHTWDTQESGRLGIYHANALVYLETCRRKGKRYHAILNDCFAAGEADHALASPHALATIRGCLEENGLYLVNMITALEGDDADALHRLVANLSCAFAFVCALPCYREPVNQPDNVIVVASSHPVGIEGSLVLYEALD